MTNLIGGRFQRGELLGEGGMGAVYRGVDTLTDETVAIKRLKHDIIAQDPDIVERFKREGEALRQLNHPNIVKMLAAFQEDDQHYLVMEYIPGGSLYDLLHHTSSLSVEHTLRIALELTDALTRAHHLNIIHRDLKPANVLIAEDGTPRLADFGIAYLRGRERVTRTSSMIGTLSYLSPEALEGQGIDNYADIWAFGVMLFEMLTGQRPFDRKTLTQTLAAILTDPPPDLEQLRPDIPVALVDLIYRMLEKDPGQRIPRFRQVGAALEAILERLDDTNSPSYDSSPPPGTGFEAVSTTTEVRKHNLPKQPTPFVGREDELAELLKLLVDPQISLITVLAPGGMGKTRLALELAANYLARPEIYANGLYLVQLAPLSSAEPIVSTVAEALGFQFYPGGEPKQQLLDYLRAKSMLIVMDNFEHVLEGAGLVSDILQSAPYIKILATSRERLNLHGEVMFTLGAMDFPDWETPEDALQYSAVKLFMQSARRAQPGFELKADDLTYVARICRRVYGVPLGIELAAAWVGMLSLDEIADEIGRSLDFLETDIRDMPERHHSLRAVFESSWKLLNDEERVTLSRVSVFRGGFSRQAAQDVTRASLRQLTTLVNKSLLHRDPESGAYRLHDLLRQYAEERLDQSGEVETIRDAHSAYYLKRVAELLPDFEGRKQLEAAKAIDSDIENVRAAWVWGSHQSSYSLIQRVVYPLWYYFDMRFLLPEGETLFEASVELLRNHPPGTEGDETLGLILLWLTDLTARLGKLAHADRLLNESEQLLASSHNPESQAWLAFIQGQSKRHNGQDMLVRTLYQKAADIFTQQDYPTRYARLMDLIGRTYWDGLKPSEWNLGEAERHSREAYSIYEKAGHREGMLHTLTSLAIYAASAGRIDESNQLNLEILRMARAFGSPSKVMPLLNNLGVNAANQGRWQEAETYFRGGLNIGRELGKLNLIVGPLGNLGYTTFLMGDFTASSQCYSEALTLIKGTEIEKHWKETTLLGIGHAAWAQGNYADANTCYQEIYALYQGQGRENNLGYMHCWMGRAALSDGRLDDALAQFKAGLSVAQKFGVLNNLAYLHMLWARLDVQRGDFVGTRQHLAEASALVQGEAIGEWLSEIELKQMRADELLILGDIARMEGQFKVSREHLQASLRLVWSVPIISNALSTLAAFADLFASEAHLEEAVELAALVENHSSAFAVDKTRAAHLLDAMREKMTPEAFHAALEAGRSRELQNVIESLLSTDKS